jgi:hypothetical protein
VPSSSSSSSSGFRGGGWGTTVGLGAWNTQSVEENLICWVIKNCTGSLTHTSSACWTTQGFSALSEYS